MTEQIKKTFAISNWCQFSEAPLGDVSGMKRELILTIMGGHPCRVTTYLDGYGSGFEERVYTING